MLTFKNRLLKQLIFIFALIFLSVRGDVLWGAIRIDETDPIFFTLVRTEMDQMREGKRGLACQDLMDRFEQAESTTTITALTRDEATWHPNDRKGTRSHTVPQDVKVRGAERLLPTAAIIFIHPHHVNPDISAYRLGYFPYNLSTALDLNLGEFSGDYRIREKRASFYRNAWRESFGLPPLDTSGGIPTTEYQEAREMGLVDEEHIADFPILDVAEFIDFGQFERIDVSDMEELTLHPFDIKPQVNHVGFFEEGGYFLKVMYISKKYFRLRFGIRRGNEFEIYKAKMERTKEGIVIPKTESGELDFSVLKDQAELLISAQTDPSSVDYSPAWERERI